MKIELIRHAFKDGYTIGKLMVNDQYFCDTLEDKDRGLDASMSEDMIRERKVYGQTAIPTGIYSVGITFWAKHRRNVPYLAKVKGFSGIFIHAGVNASHTLGCILVGKNTAVGMLSQSQDYSRRLTGIIHEAMKRGEAVTIEVRKA